MARVRSPKQVTDRMSDLNDPRYSMVSDVSTSGASSREADGTSSGSRGSRIRPLKVNAKSCEGERKRRKTPSQPVVNASDGGFEWGFRTPCFGP
eukprot:scaffold7895_cov229-Pinguiococcus_pyrenoidosus.AAC.2